MKKTIVSGSALAVFALSFAAATWAAGDNTPKPVQSTPSDMKDNSPLGAEVDQFNADNKKTVRNPSQGSARVKDQPADPQALELADDIRRYNRAAHTHGGTPAVLMQDMDIINLQTLSQRQATQKLDNDIRNYNQNGGSSDRSVDNGNQ